METVSSVMAAASAPDPERAAELFVMLRDGAMAAGCLADPDDVVRLFHRGGDGLVATL